MLLKKGVVGMIIGSGIFLKPGIVLNNAGSPLMSIAAWIVGGIITLASALSVAEIAAAIPKSGGLYIYLEELYGETIGFLLGWVQAIISYPASVAAQAIAFAILDVLEEKDLIPDTNDDSNPSNTSNPIYRIQVGAFRNRNYANRLLNELLEMDFPAYIDDSGEFYRVGVGGYGSLNEAVQMERRLKQEGYQTLIIT